MFACLTFPWDFQRHFTCWGNSRASSLTRNVLFFKPIDLGEARSAVLRGGKRIGVEGGGSHSSELALTRERLPSFLFLPHPCPLLPRPDLSPRLICLNNSLFFSLVQIVSGVAALIIIYPDFWLRKTGRPALTAIYLSHRFLSVKKWLLRKKHQIELARKRGWKGYWVCLKGTTLLFYPCDSREGRSVEAAPKHLIIVDGAIMQPIPEHPKRDYIFCLSTAFGDAYLFQVRVVLVLVLARFFLLLCLFRWEFYFRGYGGRRE